MQDRVASPVQGRRGVVADDAAARSRAPSSSSERASDEGLPGRRPVHPQWSPSSSSRRRRNSSCAAGGSPPRRGKALDRRRHRRRASPPCASDWRWADVTPLAASSTWRAPGARVRRRQEETDRAGRRGRPEAGNERARCRGSSHCHSAPPSGRVLGREVAIDGALLHPGLAGVALNESPAGLPRLDQPPGGVEKCGRRESFRAARRGLS